MFHSKADLQTVHLIYIDLNMLPFYLKGYLSSYNIQHTYTNKHSLIST